MHDSKKKMIYLDKYCHLDMPRFTLFHSCICYVNSKRFNYTQDFPSNSMAASACYFHYESFILHFFYVNLLYNALSTVSTISYIQYLT